MDRIRFEIPFSKGTNGDVFDEPTEAGLRRSIQFGMLSFHVGIVGDTDVNDPDALYPYTQDAMAEEHTLTTEINPDDLDLRLFSIKEKENGYWAADCDVSTTPFKGLNLAVICAWIPHYHPVARIHGNKVVFMVEVPSVSLN